jgi:NAD(P)-dependent dehydrogenase (short-subunit alcohol dehydrogenase family)
MKIDGHVVVVTGAGQGLGAALAEVAMDRGAAGIVIADLNGTSAAAVADRLGGLAVETDVSTPGGVELIIERAIDRYGRVDLHISNAGVGNKANAFDDDAAWARHWNVHVMAHVWAARALLPAMLERGHGGLVNVASSVALSSQPAMPAYNATKHAALALAETMAIDYHDRGIYIGCACPQGMRTPMLMQQLDSADEVTRAFGLATAIEPIEAAARIMDGIEEARFLILTHSDVQTYAQRRAADHDRWLNGMRRMYRSLETTAGK